MLAKSWQSSMLIASGAIALSVSVTLPSQALTFTGDTTNGPTFNRPQTQGYEGGTNPPTALSTNGTAVPYNSQPFTISATGAYNIIGTQNFSGIEFLYQNNFDPNNPLTNLLSGNDPFPDEGNAGFTGINLTANTPYFLVTTGFDNTSSSYGTFTNTITPVPFNFSSEQSLALGIPLFLGFRMLKKGVKTSKKA